jgi:hypothetical protein
MTNHDDTLPRLSNEDYVAKKKTEREEVFALSDQAAMNVTSDGGILQSFLDLQARLSRYSTVNALLTFAQNPDASRLGDFDYWHKKNCFIGKGEKAISILEPHTYTKSDNTPGTGYNVKKVFDISQVDARKLPAADKPKYSEEQLLSALVNDAPVKVTFVDELPNGGTGADTDMQTGEIQALKGMAFPDTFRNVARELCWAEAVHDGDIKDPQLTAYCASYVLCKKYGVDTQNYQFDSAGYMFTDMDAKTVKHELSQIRNAANAVSKQMDKQLEAPAKAAKSRDEAR